MASISLALPLLCFYVFDHFAFQLVLVGLVVQVRKCTFWSPSNLPLGFSLPIDFLSLNNPFGFSLFTFFFLQNVLDNNVCQNTPKVCFGCFAQRPFHLFQCFPLIPMFSTSDNIFWFDLHACFWKVLKLGFITMFGGSPSLLACFLTNL